MSDTEGWLDQDADASQPHQWKDVQLEDLSQLFEQKVQLLSATLESVGGKCQLMGSRLLSAEEDARLHASRLAETENRAATLRSQQEGSRDREQALRHEVIRLEALLEAERLQTSFTERKLQQLLGHERVRCDHMRALRDDAVMQRDDAVSELATAYADLDAMQATLADSAVYVRFLRKRVLELELEQSRHAAKSLSGQQGQQGPPSAEQGVFSMTSIKAAIEQAVQEASQCNEEEKRKRIKQLQLRWHPDKNPVLAELATEVTKLINQAITQLQ